MVKHTVSVLALLVALVGLALGQEGEQPLKRAKVGDYAVFKSGLENAKESQMTMRVEVIAVTDKEVTVKFTTYFKGVEPKVSEQKFDITKQYDPTGVEKNPNIIKVEDTGKGQETLKIDGKEYKCDWRANRVTAKAGDMEIVSTSKVWISKDAPVFGLVKTETKVLGQNSVMVLTEAGNKKK
jgi:hypothetical protein